MMRGKRARQIRRALVKRFGANGVPPGLYRYMKRQWTRRRGSRNA